MRPHKSCMLPRIIFEANVNASGLTDKTPGGGCVVGTACNMDDVASSDTNYLAIRVTVTATSDIVYGSIKKFLLR